MKFATNLWFAGFLALASIPALPDSSLAWLEEDQKPKEQKAEEQEEPQTEKQKQIEQKGCGPADMKVSARTDKKQHPTPEPPADQGLVYVVRPTMMGNKIQTRLAVDGKWVGVNRGNNYFFITLPPGEHYFCGQAENRSALALKVEAGKAYYLQQKIRMGFMKARTKLEQIDDKEGREALAKCHLSIMEEKK